MSELAEFRNHKDHFFASGHQSPLTPEQKVNFLGLNYFPENESLSFELEIQQFEEQKTIQMQTSTGDLQEYVHHGRIKFPVNGQEAALTVYKNDHGYFIPFVDANAGKITYGAGRYLDPPELPNGKLLIDFNHAYNPYCAYNELYSCPLPPAENCLDVAIEAGEKNFK